MPPEEMRPGETNHAVGVAERQQHRAALGDDADVAGAERLRSGARVHAGLVGDVGIAHAVRAAEQQAGLAHGRNRADAPLHGPAPARFSQAAGKTPDPLDACSVRLLKHGQQRTAAQHGGAVRRGRRSRRDA